MMTCREFFEFISAYVDGELPDDVGDKFEEHIRACPPCVDYVASFQQTIEISKICCDSTVEAETPPDEVPEELIQAILRAKKQSRGE
ncbi:MAG: zf-HC2 domain-containing protein [Planctomycetota bacterium]